MAITSLRRHDRRQQALALVREGLRTTPVYDLTGLAETEIRALFKAIHGRSPPSGAIPTSASFCSSRRAQAELSIVLGIYQQTAGSGHSRAVTGERLLQTQALYQAVWPRIGTEPRFDLTDLWVAARDLGSGVIRLSACERCGLAFAVAFNQEIPPSCPFCYFRRHRKPGRPGMHAEDHARRTCSVSAYARE